MKTIKDLESRVLFLEKQVERLAEICEKSTKILKTHEEILKEKKE